MTIEKKASNLRTIKDVTFVYTSVSHAQKQQNKDNKPALSDSPLEFHAWEIKILISEAVFKKIKKEFPGAKNLPYVKEYTPEECVERNLVQDLPDSDMVLMKFTQACLNGPKGNRKPSRPVPMIGIVNRTHDRNGAEITQETSVGNGTKGHLQFNPVENKFGLYLYPTALCITELVHYTPSNASIDVEGFDIEEGDFDVEEPVNVVEMDDEFADDIPF